MVDKTKQPDLPKGLGVPDETVQRWQDRGLIPKQPDPKEPKEATWIRGTAEPQKKT
jgi:hypothetical protein